MNKDLPPDSYTPIVKRGARLIHSSKPREESGEWRSKMILFENPVVLMELHVDLKLGRNSLYQTFTLRIVFDS